MPRQNARKPTEKGRIPQHRTDAGAFLSAEVLGAKRVILIKDEDGLYDDDPKKNPRAELIPRVSARELLKRDLPDLVVERVVVEYLTRARFCHAVQIVNGMKRGLVSRALEGEDGGTIIDREPVTRASDQDGASGFVQGSGLCAPVASPASSGAS